MKNCPKCNLEIPSEAHFCPRCLYEYPKVTKQGKKDKRKKKRAHIIIILLVFLFLNAISPLFKLLIPKDIGKKTDEQNQQIIGVMFRTNAMTPDNPEIIHDFEEVLFTDFASVSQILGEEIEEAYSDEEYMVHKFESVEIEVSQDERVKSIYIDYSNARDEIIEQYGIHGINGKISRDVARGRLGTPDQNLGDVEWYYRYDGEVGLPTLKVFFDEDGIVKALQYYTLQ